MTTAVATTKQPTDIGGLLELNRGAILQTLPKTIQADRFLRVCLNAIARNPELQKCSATSLYAGIMQSAQFGLEIGLMNQAHLVPYWNSEKRCFEAQFQIGYLGLRDLAERYGDVVDGDAQPVHEKDFFDYAKGDSPYVQHKPSKDQDRGPITHFYCWAQPKEGKIKVDVMTNAEVEEHKKRFVREKKSGGYGPAWTTTFDAMGLKTVIRRCYKLLARSPELRTAVALDEMQEINIPQNLGMELDQEQKETARIENTKRLEDLQKKDDTPAPTDMGQDGLGCAPAGQSVSEELRPASQDASPPLSPYTSQQACERLELAQSPAEIADVMNRWGENQASTPEERKKVIDHKDLAMRRLKPKKK